MELGYYNNTGSLVPYETNEPHILILGGAGKSTTLVNLALDAITADKTILFIGDDSTEQLLKRIPKRKQATVLYCNPSLFPFAFNILANIPSDDHARFTTTVLESVKTVWEYTTPTPVLDQYIRATVQTLLQIPDSSLISAKFLLTDKSYRTSITDKLTDPVLYNFWQDYDTLTPKEQRQDTASTLNKLRAFMFEPRIRRCLDQKDNKMDFSKTVLVSLNKKTLGTENARLFGALVLASYNGLSFVDDAYLYGGGSIVTARNLDQFSKAQRPAILQKRILALRTTSKDAKTISEDFHLTNDQTPLNRLERFRAYWQEGDRAVELYLREMDYPLTHQEQKIIRRCMSQCTQPVAAIDKRLGRFFNA